MEISRAISGDYQKKIIRENMKYPNYKKEKKFFSQGMRCIVALDEAGRGAWAGPLVSGGIVMRSGGLKRQNWYSLVRDSKLLSEKQRERAYEFITRHFSYFFSIVEPKEIDRLGLTQANQLAVDRVVAQIKENIDFILMDGRGFHFSHPHENIVHGDRMVFSIAAASIIAKVTRDRIMRGYDMQYIQYGFTRHKGYGTRYHFQMLKKHGVCPIHRRSYEPIVKLLEE